MFDLDPAVKEAYARAKTSVVDLFCFELRHSTFPEPIRMVSYNEDITITLEATAPINAGEEVTFTGVAFKAPAENVDTEPGNTITVRVDGISSQALPYLNAANATLEPIAATTRYIAYDTRLKEVLGSGLPTEMQVRSFVTTMLSVQMTLGFTNLNTRVLDV